jgi:Trypsin
VKRITVTGAALLIALAVGAALPSVSLASAAGSAIEGPLVSSPLLTPEVAVSAYVSPLLALEEATLLQRRIPSVRASEAIGVQSEIAQSHLVRKLEVAMAGGFAGVWFEAASAELRVGVTSTVGREAAEAVSARAGLANHVVVTPVHSTWAQLRSAQKRWNSRLAKLAPAQAETALAPQSNAMDVTLTSAVPPAMRDELARAASRADVNVLVSSARAAHSPDTPQAATACKPFVKGAAYCDPSITSGVTIGTSTTPKLCTAGPLAIPRGGTKNTTFLLTAGHCISTVGEPWFSLNRSGSKGEIGTVQSFVFSKSGDFAAIQVAPGFWTNPEAKNPVFAVMARWGVANPTKSYPVIGEGTPIVGAMSCHEGMVSGESCGTITKLMGTLVQKTFTVEGLVEVQGAKGEGGDSGGPWFSINTKNELLMEGTHSGEKSATGNLVFEPLRTTLAALNLELLTVSNEVRP